MGELNEDIRKDLSVGRHLAVGGRVRVEGGVHVSKNLRVDGYLEATRLKAASKGLFASVEGLRAAYPEPQDGWWALVGDHFPAQIWRAQGGSWGQEPVGEVGSEDLEIDLDGLTGSIEAEAEAREGADAALGERIDTTNSNLNSAIEAEAEAREGADGTLGERIDTVESELRLAEGNIEGLSESIGELEGADTSLGERIDGLGTQVSGLSTGLGTEITQRERAIAGEAEAREAADAALGERIDTTNSNLNSAIEAIQTVNVVSLGRDAALGERIDGKLDKGAIVVLSESEYEALGDDVDPEKYYFITEDEE